MTASVSGLSITFKLSGFAFRSAKSVAFLHSIFFMVLSDALWLFLSTVCSFFLETDCIEYRSVFNRTFSSRLTVVASAIRDAQRSAGTGQCSWIRWPISVLTSQFGEKKGGPSHSMLNEDDDLTKLLGFVRTGKQYPKRLMWVICNKCHRSSYKKPQRNPFSKCSNIIARRHYLLPTTQCSRNKCILIQRISGPVVALIKSLNQHIHHR